MKRDDRTDLVHAADFDPRRYVRCTPVLRDESERADFVSVPHEPVRVPLRVLPVLRRSLVPADVQDHAHDWLREFLTLRVLTDDGRSADDFDLRPPSVILRVLDYVSSLSREP